MKFHQDRTQDKKVMAFYNSCTKAVLSALPGPTTKRCEPQLFLAAIGQVVRLWKALNLGSLNMQFLHDWPKDKKITTLLIFWPENLEKKFARLSFIMCLLMDRQFFFIAAPRAIRC